jgi:hypothetical protein
MDQSLKTTTKLALLMELYVLIDSFCCHFIDHSKFSSVSYNQIVKPPGNQLLEVRGQCGTTNKENSHASMPVGLIILLFIFCNTIVYRTSFEQSQEQ